MNAAGRIPHCGDMSPDLNARKVDRFHCPEMERIQDRESRGSAAAPETMHAGHDDGAARPEFLNIGRGAIAHRIRPGIVARIDIVTVIRARMNPQACRRPLGSATLRRQIGCGLRDFLRDLSRGLRLDRTRRRDGRSQHRRCKSPSCRRRPDPHYPAPSDR